MAPKSQPDDVSPGADTAREEPTRKPRPDTRFPGGNELLELTLNPSPEVKLKERAEKPRRIPLPVNQPSAAPSRPPLAAAGKKGQSSEPFTPLTEDPWSTYAPIRSLERGGEVTAAHTKGVPVEMVVVKKLSSEFIKELRKCEHLNLLSTIAVYQHGKEFFVVTDYTVVTLQQIIATRRPLQELHVSVTCRQASPRPAASSL
jgi:hypothetical protein